MINANRAKTLLEALPYIARHKDKVMVIKYGGSAMKKESIKESVVEDLLLMSYVGIKIVLVHGGGDEINKVLAKYNLDVKFVDGLRYTDEETMNIVQMVLTGKVNKDLVKKINTLGGKAIGISGIDNNLIECVPYDNYKLGYVGTIKNINSDIIKDNLAHDYISVIASVGIGESGESFNINADVAATEIAKSINADKLILLTDVPGVLENQKDEHSLISQIYDVEVPTLFDKGIISGGMIPKIKSCVDALNNGVNRVHILDGRIPHSIIMELFSDDGIGTLICKENEPEYKKVEKERVNA
ncbi:MAG: acetylglutamate kinase [Clostridioides sp.]|jgi:acetylglutamate kinase|nr:acetylglutamate kinase [Clostridioides sp.]